MWQRQGLSQYQAARSEVAGTITDVPDTGVLLSGLGWNRVNERSKVEASHFSIGGPEKAKRATKSTSPRTERG